MGSGALGIKPYSSHVRLWLEHGDTYSNLAEVGPDFVRPREPAEPPERGVLAISVDGNVQRKAVTLSGDESMWRYEREGSDDG